MHKKLAVRRSARWGGALLGCGAICGVGPAMAQTMLSGPIDEIVVTGERATQRSSIEVKRTATTIVDAVTSQQIGALPDNSIAETLTRITGVTGDRFKGSASEISIRGMGPFLGFSTFNGRDVSTGGSDRTVSFQQFPSELVNGVVVYKAQQADLVEGGVSGVVDLRSAKPLDYPGRQIQFEYKQQYDPYDAKIKSSNGRGYRMSGSYIDRFESSSLGEIGVNLGVVRVDATAPDDFYTTSSSFRPCNTTAANSRTGAECAFNPATRVPAYFVSNNYDYRQLITVEHRTALVGDLQWQPTKKLDINLDAQWSNRDSLEDGHDLNIAEARRGIANQVVADNGGLLAWNGNSRLEAQTRLRNREESYLGTALSARWDDGPWTISGDASYSGSHRNQVDRNTRLRTGTTTGFDSGRVPYRLDGTSLDVPSADFGTFDVNNHAFFNDAAYARRDMEDHKDRIAALRGDIEYQFASGFLTKLKGGIRIARHTRQADLDNNNDIDPVSAALATAANANCRIAFPENNWMGASSTNLHSWATFDSECMYKTLSGGFDDRGPLADSRSTSDINVKERTAAAYIMGSFATELGDIPVTGNAGVRVIRTWEESTGYRGALNLVTSTSGGIRLVPAGDFTTVRITNEFTDVLPSINVNFGLKSNLQLRFAIYRALARPNPEEMGAGRSFVTSTTDVTSVRDAISGVTGGNPKLEPLRAWNFDTSLEWYPNRDTLLSIAGFYKTFKAGIVPAGASSTLPETFVIGGQSYLLNVAQETNSSQSNYIYGFETNLQHAFTWLPSPLDGFGVQIGYTYADSDFKYADPSATDSANPLANFPATAAGLIGLSKHTLSAVGFWEKWDTSVRLAYRYRSDYFKPSLLSANRTVRSAGLLDLAIAYDLTQNLQLKFQVLNLTNEPQIMDRPVTGSVTQAEYTGPTFFAGAKLHF